MATSSRPVSLADVYLKLCAERRIEPYYPFVSRAGEGVLDVDAEFVLDDAWSFLVSAMRASTTASYQRIRIAVGDNFGPRHPPKQSRRLVSFESLAAQRAPRAPAEQVVPRLIQGIAHQAALSLQALRELRLVGIPVGPSGAAKLADALGACTHLQELQLDCSNITNAGLAELVPALKKLPELVTVSLRRAALTSGAAEDLGKLVAGNTVSRHWESTLRSTARSGPPRAIEVLVLSENPIGDSVVKELCKQDGFVRHMCHVDLTGTAVTQAGALQLLRLLDGRRRTALRTVTLSRTPAAASFVDVDVEEGDVRVASYGGGGEHCVLHRSNGGDQMGSRRAASASHRTRSPPAAASKKSAAATADARNTQKPRSHLPAPITMTTDDARYGLDDDFVESGDTGNDSLAALEIQMFSHVQPKNTATRRGPGAAVQPTRQGRDATKRSPSNRNDPAAGEFDPALTSRSSERIPQLRSSSPGTFPGPGPTAAISSSREAMLEAALLMYQRRCLELETGVMQRGGGGSFVGGGVPPRPASANSNGLQRGPSFAQVLDARRALRSAGTSPIPLQDAATGTFPAEAQGHEAGTSTAESGRPITLNELGLENDDDGEVSTSATDDAVHRRRTALLQGSDPVLARGDIAAAVRREIEAVLEASEQDKTELVAAVASYVSSALEAVQQTTVESSERLAAQLTEQARLVERLERRLEDTSAALQTAESSARAGQAAAGAHALQPRIVVLPRDFDDDDEVRGPTATVLRSAINRVLGRVQQAIGIDVPLPDLDVSSANRPRGTAPRDVTASTVVKSSVPPPQNTSASVPNAPASTTTLSSSNDEVRLRLAKLGW
jgi:hypothetical protein